MKHEYLMSIERYFGGEERFQVSADNKAEAVERAKDTSFYRSDNTISSSLKCIRKLKPSFGRKEET